MKKSNRVSINYDDLFPTLMLYDTENNRDIIGWIIDNKEDVLTVMSCVDDTGIDRKIVNRIFRDLSDKNILTPKNISSLENKDEFLSEHNLDGRTKKVYEIRKEGIQQFIDDWLELVDKIIWWFL
jgi:DNA-binding transcriptional regulator YhcF (GntR family)